MRFRTRTRRTSCRKSMDSRSWRKLIHAGDRVNGFRSSDCSAFFVSTKVRGTREFSTLLRVSCDPRNRKMAHLRRPARREHYKPFGRRKVNETRITSCCLFLLTPNFYPRNCKLSVGFYLLRIIDPVFSIRLFLRILNKLVNWGT